ncbi:MAG: hypothetical protein ABF335_00540 [Alphaproteobacteria bacterium]
MKLILRFSALTLGLLVLAACSPNSTGPGTLIGELRGDARGCPAIGVLEHAVDITVFQPGKGRDLTDVEYEGEFRGVGTSCDYDEDDRLIEAEASFKILARRGPAARNSQIELPIFVAIVAAGGEIVDKRQYPVLLKFDEGTEVAQVADTLEDIKIYLERGDSTRSYEILIGFQLSESQLAYNRSRQR